jgi:AcrR family transcriptional regulator
MAVERRIRRTRSDSKVRTRTDLLAAAREVFLKRGFHAATLDEIAEEAGYTKGAVYSNFAGKDDLFLAMLAEHYARRAEVYAALVLEPNDIEETYRAVAMFMFEAYQREPAWWPLVSDFSSHASKDPELRERLHELREGFIDAVAATIEALAARHGTTFVLPAREIARGSGALMRGMAVEWSIDPAPADAAVFREMHAAYLRGLAAPRHERSIT